MDWSRIGRKVLERHRDRLTGTAGVVTKRAQIAIFGVVGHFGIVGQRWKRKCSLWRDRRIERDLILHCLNRPRAIWQCGDGSRRSKDGAISRKRLVEVLPLGRCGGPRSRGSRFGCTAWLA